MTKIADTIAAFFVKSKLIIEEERACGWHQKDISVVLSVF